MKYRDDNKETEEGEVSEDEDEEAMDSVRSRLAGRLGYRDQRDVPKKTQTGKDLRDRLNRDLDDLKGKGKKIDKGPEITIYQCFVILF